MDIGFVGRHRIGRIHIDDLSAPLPQLPQHDPRAYIGVKQVPAPEHQGAAVFQVRHGGTSSKGQSPGQGKGLKAGAGFRAEIGRAEGVCKPQQGRPVPLGIARIKDNGFRPMAFPDPKQLFCHEIISFVPADPFKTAASLFACPYHGIAQPFLVVNVLQGSRPLGAEAACAAALLTGLYG